MSFMFFFYDIEVENIEDDSEEEVFFEGELVSVHTSCAELYRDITLDSSVYENEAELEAAKINFECGTKIFGRYLSTDILNGTQYIVGKLDEEAEQEGNIMGGVFAVASLDHDKREYTQIYRLNINCDNDKLFTKVANFVYRNLDIHKQLEDIMTDKFIEKIEKYAEK